MSNLINTKHKIGNQLFSETIDLIISHSVYQNSCISFNCDKESIEILNISIDAVIDNLSNHINKLNNELWFNVLNEIPGNILSDYLELTRDSY